MSELKTTTESCTCGRVWTHCRHCGSRNVYVKKFRSMEVSVTLGREITVYSCRRCSGESNETESCNAPSTTSKLASPAFVPFQRPSTTELPAWGHAVPGTNEHLRLLNEWITDKQQSEGWDRVRVYVEAQKAGWHLEAYDMDEDVKAALKDLGLLCQQDKTETEATMRGETGAVATEKPPSHPSGASHSSNEEATVISLDEIIQRMQAK